MKHLSFLKRFSFLFFLFSLFFIVSASASEVASTNENDDAEYNTPGNGALADSNIQYFGRWDKSSATVYKSHWLGAYIRVDFTGTSIKINMEGSRWLVVQIDGEIPRTIYASDGMELSAGNLASGRHILLVGPSDLYNNQLAFKGFTLASGGVTYKSDKKLLIEFIGDSITAGGGDYPKDIYNYVWLVSDKLDCDHTQIAYPGLALCTGYTYYTGATRNTAQAVGMDQLYFSMKDLPNFVSDGFTITTPWTMSTYTPDVVFLFLGTNDSSNGGLYSTDASPALFKQKLGELFASARSNYSNAHLICMVPFSGVYKSEIASQIQTMRDAGDKRVHVINTTGWLTSTDFSDGIHPNASGTTKIVNNLHTVLIPLMQSIEAGTDYEIPNGSVTSDKFYLVPSAQWKDGSASFGAIFKNGSTEEKAAFTYNSSIDKYELNIPAGDWPQICIRRYSSDGSAEWGGFTTFNEVTETHTSNFISYNKAFNHIEIIGWADGTDPSGYITSTYGSVTPEPTKGITVRYKKPADWQNVYIHAWDNVGTPLSGFNWPGNLMTADPDNDGWYYYTFDSSITYLSCQFNNGTATGLVVVEHITASSNYNEDGTVNTDIGTDPPNPPDEEITIRYKKPSDWTSVNIHAWNNSGQSLVSSDPADWFGAPMTAEGNGWYYYTFKKSKLTNGFYFTFNNANLAALVEVRNETTMSNVTESTSYDENGNVADVSSVEPIGNVLTAVSATNNHIIVSFDGTASIEVYTVMGQRLFAGQVAGGFEYPADAGIYLVKINDKTFKVLVQ